MKKIIGLLFCCLLAATSAFAGSGTVLYTSAGSSTYRVGTDGSGNFFGMSALCDGAACALIASVTAAGTSGTNGLAVQGMTSGVPLPVSASALPLPTGAATAALQSTINTTLGTPMQASGGSVTANAGTNLNTSALATSAAQTTGNGSLATIATASASQATAANQATGNASLATIASNTGAAVPAGTNNIGYMPLSPGAAAIASAQVSVAATQTSIVAARTGVPGTGRVSVTIVNTTTTPIYLGPTGVTTSNGQLLPGVVGASITLNTNAQIFGIVGTGTATVTEMETF